MRNQQEALLDWSNFNEAEQQSIAITSSNFEQGTSLPPFPFTAAVLDELGENLVHIALVRPNSAKKCMDELAVFERVLLAQMPKAPRDEDEPTAKQVQEFLLYSTVMCFLVEQFKQLHQQMAFSLELLENQAQGGRNGKH